VFVVYPAAIAHMPGSPVWAALFFVFLFTVGVDSQVSSSLQMYCNEFMNTLKYSNSSQGLFWPHSVVKGYFNPEKYTIQNEHLCKLKFCIGHKSDDGIL